REVRSVPILSIPDSTSFLCDSMVRNRSRSREESVKYAAGDLKMSIRAIYKDGVFKPLEDVPMKEGTEVEVYPRDEVYPREESEEKGNGKTRKSVFDLEFFGMWKNRDDIGTGVEY